MKKLTKAEMFRDSSGYYSTGLYKELKPQEISILANTHNEFSAILNEVIEIVPSVDIYYLITQAGTAATADGNACFFLRMGERREISCTIGDIVSVISVSAGKVNMTEKG